MDNRGDHKPRLYLKCQVQDCVASTLNENRMQFLDLSHFLKSFIDVPCHDIKSMMNQSVS